MFEIGRLTRLELGYVGETESRSIQIDVSEWLERWPQAVIAIWVRRPDKMGYTAATEVEDGILTWTVTAGDVEQAGDGMAQIKALDPMDTGAIYKSRTVATKIYASLEEMSSDPDAPDPMESWANQAAIYKEEAYRAKEAAQAAAADANGSAEDAAESEASAAASAKSANDAALAATDAASAAIQARQIAEAAQAASAEAAAAAEGSAERAASAEKEAGDAADVATSKANAAEESASTAEEARRAASAAAGTAATEASEATTASSEAKKSAEAADLARLKAETNAGTAVQAMTRAEAGAAQSEKNAAEAADAKAAAASAAEEATDSAANAKSHAEDAKSHAEAAAEHAQTAEAAAKLAKESAADTAPAIVQQASGAIVTLTDGAARPALSLVSQISAVQSGSGDPSPDNIRPITGWDALTLYRSGRNMIKFPYIDGGAGDTISKNGLTITIGEDGSVHVVGTASTTTFVNLCSMPGLAESNITEGSMVGGITATDCRYTYANGLVTIRIAGGTTVDKTYYPMLTTAGAADFEFYDGQTLTAELHETVYGGTLDWLTGVLTVSYVSLTLDGSESWNAATVGENPALWMDITDNPPSDSTVTGSGLMCSHMTPTNYPYQLAEYGEWKIGFNSQRTQLYISTSMDAEAFATWLSEKAAAGTPVTVAYQMPEPYTIQLDPQTLDMLRGYNTIWCRTGSTAVGYVADTKTYVESHGGGGDAGYAEYAAYAERAGEADTIGGMAVQAVSLADWETITPSATTIYLIYDAEVAT